MKRVTFKILFFVKKTRVSKNGEVPILLRITVNGFRADTSINLKVNPDLWNSVAGKSIGKDRTSAELNHKFITDYEFYLRTERNCSHNTATKYLKNFKKIIRIALANEYITKDPFVNIKFRLEEVDKDFLEDHEIHKIMEKEITVERLAHVRDTFIFATFTGLAFSDLKGLKLEHLAIDNNGSVWIRKKRQKTKNMCNIPLLEVPQQILEKYKDHPSCIKNGILLPVISNVKMNAYLKELADICGITKTITTHTARYSFASSVALANVQKRFSATQNQWTMKGKITISENGVVSVPDNVMMQDFEIAEFFEVMIPTIRANIRATLKSGVVVADTGHGGTILGNAFYPDYYGLDMVVALAFRVQSRQAEIFREWTLRKCLATDRQPIVLQYNYAQNCLNEQN